jgi:hypothetical protein
VRSILVAVVFLLLYGIMNLQPLMAQSLMGYTAYISGLAQAPRGMGLLVSDAAGGTFDRESGQPSADWPRNVIDRDVPR